MKRTRTKWLLLACLLLVGLSAAFFAPKSSGRYCPLTGCDPWGKTRYFDCQCVGQKLGNPGTDASGSICYGIPFRCADMEVYTPPPAAATPMPTATVGAND